MTNGMFGIDGLLINGALLHLNVGLHPHVGLYLSVGLHTSVGLHPTLMKAPRCGLHYRHHAPNRNAAPSSARPNGLGKMCEGKGLGKPCAETPVRSFHRISQESIVKSIVVFIACLVTVSAFSQNKTITVAKDGAGDYTTVQAAFNAVPSNNKKLVTVFVRKGVYKEKLLLDSSKRFVTLVGEDKFNTVLTYDDHTGKIAPDGKAINTRTSWSFKILADDFTAQNITFQNDAGFAAGQAVAVEADGDRAVFKNCRFVGNQDVLFTNSDRSRQYYELCYIEGTTDFIFGSATAWFQQCHIHSKKNSHVTAASTPKGKAYGYVFNECILTGDTSLRNVSLGRPWQPHASVAYLRCYIGPHIRPEGWATWNNNDNHLTARYAEYKNFGPSASPATRVNWARQLSDAEAAAITMKNVFNDWNPRNTNR